MSTSRCLIPLLLVSLAFGCRHRGVDLPTAPVSGRVLYKGKPLAGGRIAMIHSSGHPAGAELAADGSFHLTAYQGGNRVSVECYDFDVPGSQKKRPRIPENWISVIPARYANYGTSGLTFEVKPGENEKTEFVLKD